MYITFLVFSLFSQIKLFYTTARSSTHHRAVTFCGLWTKSYIYWRSQVRFRRLAAAVQARRHIEKGVGYQSEQFILSRLLHGITNKTFSLVKFCPLETSFIHSFFHFIFIVHLGNMFLPDTIEFSDTHFYQIKIMVVNSKLSFMDVLT